MKIQKLVLVFVAALFAVSAFGQKAKGAGPEITAMMNKPNASVPMWYRIERLTEEATGVEPKG